jgi:hypothetical protein
MIDVLLLLIFCPYAYFQNEGKFYNSFKLLRKTTSIEFKYLFSSQDIREINEIRKYLNLLIKAGGQEPEIIAERRAILVKKILAVISKPRIRVITDKHWIELCQKYSKELGDDVNPMNKQIACLYEPTVIDDTNKQVNDFLPMLQPLDFDEEVRLLTEEGLNQIAKERDNYTRMRRRVLENIDRVKKLYHEQHMSMMCRNCKRSVGPIKNLEPLGEIKPIGKNVYKINGSASLYFDVVEGSEDLTNNMFVTEYKGTYSNMPTEWVACNHCQAILGTRDPIAYFYYVYDISDMYIKLPVIDEMRTWDPKLIYDRPQIVSLENRALQERERMLNAMGKECEVCGESFKDSYTYVMKHLESIKHKERLNELRDATFI